MADVYGGYRLDNTYRYFFQVGILLPELTVDWQVRHSTTCVLDCTRKRIIRYHYAQIPSSYIRYSSGPTGTRTGCSVEKGKKCVGVPVLQSHLLTYQTCIQWRLLRVGITARLVTQDLHNYTDAALPLINLPALYSHLH